ncbi:hypothetical protein AVEN_61928-1 [Araneus ventricosus]|uniref:Uncharacterized protein n=1 Tax=Araneus ventricosus TaxID=182803 RepID=A0A4Y2SKA3_ARAVE|nr:hypothetical protein AVEN_61928-1 [Araneus ventricosus]
MLISSHVSKQHLIANLLQRNIVITENAAAYCSEVRMSQSGGFEIEVEEAQSVEMERPSDNRRWSPPKKKLPFQACRKTSIYSIEREDRMQDPLSHDSFASYFFASR